jgi:hypothetical protein
MPLDKERPRWNGAGRRDGESVNSQYRTRRRRRCNVPHQIVYSVQKAKRGYLFPVDLVDATTGDRHDCEVHHGR